MIWSLRCCVVAKGVHALSSKMKDFDAWGALGLIGAMFRFLRHFRNTSVGAVRVMIKLKQWLLFWQRTEPVEVDFNVAYVEPWIAQSIRDFEHQMDQVAIARRGLILISLSAHNT